MVPATLDLGRLDLVSTTSGLQLQLESLAQFAPFAEDDDNAERSLTAQLLTADRRDRPWICRASNFRLVLGLRIADDLHVADRDALMNELAISLREANV